MMALKALVKNGFIKPLKPIDLPEDKEIVIYISEENMEEKTNFFFLSAFGFWNDVGEDLYQHYLVHEDS